MSRRAKQPPPTPERQDYLASVSDLMSGLIFIFIITLAVFSLRLAEAQQRLDDTEKRLRSADAVRSELLAKLEKQLLDEGIQVEVDPVQGVLRLTDKAISFERGKAEPQPPENVGTVASVLLRVLPAYVASCVPPNDMLEVAASRPAFCSMARDFAADRDCGSHQEDDPRVDTVLVEGHTDSVPIRQLSKYKDNLELSAARSSEVLRMMTDVCEPALRGLLNRSGAPVVSVSGYGETRPVDEQDREADVNRRIDLRFLMELPREEEQTLGEPEPIEATREGLSS